MSYTVDRKQYQESTGATRKKLAQQICEARKADIARGKWDIAKNKNPLFDDLCKAFMVYSRTNKKSWLKDEHSIKHLLDYFGGMKASEITLFGIEGYKKDRLKKVKPATLNRELACLKTIFNLAIKDNRLSRNPMRGVRLLREDNQVERILTDQESQKLIMCSKGHLRAIIVTARNTGMRLSEILNLQWESIDASTSYIKVANTKSEKTRWIPVNPELRQTLQSLNKSDPYVFSGQKPLKSVKNPFTKVCREAGIEEFRFHDLRHTFASNLVAYGADIVTVKELLGHSDIRMTMRYAHVREDTKRRAVNALSEKKYDNSMTLTHPEPSLEVRNSLRANM